MAKQIRIAVMGATGSGKTTFINRASGSDFPSKVVLRVARQTRGRQSRSFSTVAIAAYLSNTRLFLYTQTYIRMSSTSKRDFHIFHELCGESTLSNVLIATNMWGNVDPKIGEERERELATSDKLFKPVLEKGAQLLRHDNTEASAHTILRNLINSQTATLAIQHEIVNQRKDLARTAAGAELTRLLKEQAERYGDEVRKLCGELELATRTKDEARKELQEEVEKKRGEIERIQRDVGRMAMDFLVERARLESRIVEMEAENRRKWKVESMQIEHARRESELLAVQREEFECTTRLLVEERLARKQAEAQCGRVQANGAGTEVERAPDKIQIEDAKRQQMLQEDQNHMRPSEGKTRILYGQNFLAEAARDPAQIPDGTSSSNSERVNNIRA
ncbi:hypothetical protein EDC04DRAFT_3000249 [Pisolithus marmoratus]|nr:hypothetical protein EDC04DRAFT_3000249 [Pisolithus marmoratus]